MKALPHLQTCLFLFLILAKPLFSEEQSEESTTPTPDIGCTANRPALCSNGGCFENYSFCQPVRGCVTAPDTLMCPSGACTSDFSLCSESTYGCDLDKYIRCPDGICRIHCQEILTNGCPASAPFYCPSGKCGKTMLECTGTLNRLQMHSQETLPVC